MPIRCHICDIAIQWPYVAILIQILQNRSVPSEVYFTYWLHLIRQNSGSHVLFTVHTSRIFESYPSYHGNNKKTVVAIILNYNMIVFRFGNR